MNGEVYVVLIAQGIRNGVVDADAAVQLGFYRGDNHEKLIARFWTGVQPPLYHELRQMSQRHFDWLVDAGYLAPVGNNIYAFNIKAFITAGGEP